MKPFANIKAKSSGREVYFSIERLHVTFDILKAAINDDDDDTDDDENVDDANKIVFKGM